MTLTFKALGIGGVMSQLPRALGRAKHEEVPGPLALLEGQGLNTVLAC